MKKILFTFLFITLTSQFIFSQEETLINSGEIAHGGYGAPVVKFTKVNGVFGLLLGGKGGWIINHTFAIGGGGYGLVNNIETGRTFLGQKQLLQFGYGGVELEYINNSDRLIHFTAAVLIGGGSLSYRYGNDWDWDEEDWDTDHNNFFVAEPSINVDLNIASFFRIGVGASYRFISGVDLDDFINSDLAGPSASIMLKFGKF